MATGSSQRAIIFSDGGHVVAWELDFRVPSEMHGKIVASLISETVHPRAKRSKNSNIPSTVLY